MSDVRLYTVDLDIRNEKDLTMLTSAQCAEKYIRKLVGKCMLGVYVLDVEKVVRHSQVRLSNASLSMCGKISVAAALRVMTYPEGMFLAGVRIPKTWKKDQFRVSFRNLNLIMHDEQILGMFDPGSRIPVRLSTTTLEQDSSKVVAYAELARPLEGEVETYVLSAGVEKDKLDSLSRLCGSISESLKKRKKLKYARVFDPEKFPKGKFLGDFEFLEKFSGGTVQFSLNSLGEFAVLDEKKKKTAIAKDDAVLSGSAFAAFASMLARCIQYIDFLVDMEEDDNECPKLFELFER